MSKIDNLEYDFVVRDNYRPYIIDMPIEYRKTVIQNISSAEINANLILRTNLPRATVFAFEKDMALDIIESNISMISPLDLKLPFENIYIDFGDIINIEVMDSVEKASGLQICRINFDEYSKIVLSWYPAFVIETEIPVTKDDKLLAIGLWGRAPKVKTFTGISNIDKIMSHLNKWTLSYHIEPLINGAKWTGDYKKEVYMLATKFVAFLSSVNVSYNTIIERPSIKMKVNGQKVVCKRKPVRVIKFLKEYSVNVYPERKITGRKITVRHWVRGHIKKFRRGKIYEKALKNAKIKEGEAVLVWCPKHLRGPEIGELIARRYLVSN